MNSKPWLALPSTLPSGGKDAGVSSRKLKIHFSVYTEPEHIIAWVLRSGREESQCGRGERKRKTKRRKPVYGSGPFSYGKVQGVVGSCSSEHPEEKQLCKCPGVVGKVYK